MKYIGQARHYRPNRLSSGSTSEHRHAILGQVQLGKDG